MNKYKNNRIKYKGMTFDSKKEYERFLTLEKKESCGEISNLTRQVPFTLIESQYVDGKCVERPLKYIADFVYTENGKQVIEDVKGYRKGQAYSMFVVKRKLMLKIHGIRIREV